MQAKILIPALMSAAVLGWSVTAGATNITMRLGHGQSTKDVIHLAALEFKKSLEEKTHRQVRVLIYPSSQLGKIRDMFEGLRLGTIHAVFDAPSRLANYTPLGDVFKLPYLVETREQAEAMWASKYGQSILSDIAEESGISVVAVAWRGARNITSNREIHAPDDMAGLKIRVPPNDLPVAIFRTLGASPTPMEFNEVYLALQQGIIDAQENPLVTCWTSRLQEVTKYLVLTGHIKDSAGIMMGKDYLDSLPADVRQAVREAAAVAAKFHGDFVEKEDAQYVQKFKDAGVTVIEPDQKKFRAKFNGFVQNYNPKLGEFVAKVHALK